MEVKAGDAFQVPLKVLQTAVYGPRIDFQMNIRAVRGSLGERVYVVMHFSELVKLNSANESRQLKISGTDGKVTFFSDYSPPYLRVDHKEITNVSLDGSGFYNITITVSSSSTHSLMINSLESFIVREMNESETDDRDGETAEKNPCSLHFISLCSLSLYPS